MFGGLVRIADHAAWDRGFPVKYLLVREDEEGEEKYWGRCASVEGMFVDKVPPKREVLTLRGCTPTGSLRDALSPAAESTGLLGDVCVEVWDDQQPLQWWTLVDAVVLANQPNRNDPALVDVVVGAGVEEEHAWDHTLPVSPQFKLFGGTTMVASPAGHCLGARAGPRHRLHCTSSDAKPLNLCSPSCVDPASGTGTGCNCGRWTATAR